MSDLISREELKKTVKRMESLPWGDEEGNRVEFKWSSELVEHLIDKAPSVEPGWIPVSERLPENEGRYLISHQNGKIFIDEWIDGCGWSFFEAITAWMELPKPYEEEVEIGWRI